MDDPFAEWVEGPVNARLAKNEVHVWGWSLAGGVEDLARVHALLSGDELARMRSFRFAPDAERYARSRAGLRRILSRYIGIDPTVLSFLYGKHGKPSLREDQRGIAFNISHTQSITVAAFSVAGPVGIDVEEHRPVSRTLEDQVFSEQEQWSMRSLLNQQYTQAFFNGWTRKEAICKAEGLGFYLPPKSFRVSLSPGQPARINDAGGVLSRDWSLIDLPLGGATTGCVAVVAPSIVRLYRIATANADSLRE